MLDKKQKRYRRHKRVRAGIAGTEERPRLCLFRSPKHIYCQLIDDEKGKTIVSASDREVKKEKKTNKKPKGKIAIAHETGELLALKALKVKIEKVVFDRSGYKYHGRVKAFAEGARQGGLKF